MFRECWRVFSLPKKWQRNYCNFPAYESWRRRSRKKTRRMSIILWICAFANEQHNKRQGTCYPGKAQEGLLCCMHVGQTRSKQHTKTKTQGRWLLSTKCRYSWMAVIKESRRRIICWAIEDIKESFMATLSTERTEFLFCIFVLDDWRRSCCCSMSYNSRRTYKWNCRQFTFMICALGCPVVVGSCFCHWKECVEN